MENEELIKLMNDGRRTFNRPCDLSYLVRDIITVDFKIPILVNNPDYCSSKNNNVFNVEYISFENYSDKLTVENFLLGLDRVNDFYDMPSMSFIELNLLPKKTSQYHNKEILKIGLRSEEAYDIIFSFNYDKRESSYCANSSKQPSHLSQIMNPCIGPNVVDLKK